MTDTVNTDGDRRRAIFPSPPQPGPEQEHFAPYPHRLAQPDVASGLLMGGASNVKREGDTVTWKPEGEELRPPHGPFPPEVKGLALVEHHHHHVVNVYTRGHAAHRALRIVIDNSQPAFQILPTDSDRVRATVLNESTASSGIATPSNIDIGDRPTSGTLYGSGEGFRLVPGASQDVRDTQEVWASCDGTHTTVVSVWVTRNSPFQGDTQSDD